MASSATNKQPLLVDRPLHETATIGDIAALTNASNFNTPSPSGCVLLVDCSANEGAVLDSLSVLITQNGTAEVAVLAFLSGSSTASGINALNTHFIAGIAIPSGNTAGQRLHVTLPPLTVPVPPLASPAATMATYPTEIDKKNTGLYIPSGKCLYVGVATVISTPSSATRVIAAAQGGYY